MKAQREAEIVRRKVDEWLANGGDVELRAALERARAMGKAIQESLRPDTATLAKSMTI